MTINFNINVTFSETVIQPQLSQMDLYVLPSTDQIEVTTLQEPYRSPVTIISSPGPMGLLILTSVLFPLSL